MAATCVVACNHHQQQHLQHTRTRTGSIFLQVCCPLCSQVQQTADSKAPVCAYQGAEGRNLMTNRCRLGVVEGQERSPVTFLLCRGRRRRCCAALLGYWVLGTLSLGWSDGAPSTEASTIRIGEVYNSVVYRTGADWTTSMHYSMLP